MAPPTPFPPPPPRAFEREVGLRPPLPPTAAAGPKGGDERPPKAYEAVKLPTPEQIAQEDFMNHCATRGVISVVMGGLMGAVMGVVFAGVESPAPGSPAFHELSMRQHLAAGLKAARERSSSYARTFAYLGGLYSTSECVVEKFRARHDVTNSAIAGCFSGGFMAVRQGPTAIVGGCATFAAFSVLIDKVMDV